MTEYLGRAERMRAADLIARLPAAFPGLRWSGVDLRPSAEHLLYVALRQPSVASAEGRLGAARSVGRVVREGARVITGRGGRQRDPVDLVILVTQPVHATLFAPVAEQLPGHVRLVLVDARTGAGRRRGRLPAVTDELAGQLSLTDAPGLANHAAAVARGFAAPPNDWGDAIGREEAERLAGILRRGLPLVALDAARVKGLVDQRRPSAVACFSESGLLARIVPAVAAARGDRFAVVDLPHAEAADPWGTAGVGYDGVAVYGPRAAGVMALAGIRADRVVQVGPLRYDGLLSRQPDPPRESPRRVVLASQPADPLKRAVHPDVKRAVLRAAIGATAALAPGELRIVPHPTETDGITEEFLAGAEVPPDVEVRLDPVGSLHDVLPGAWLLMTGASQSVFDAVLSGVPAITVNATGGPDPVTFASEGIALGASSVEAAISLARDLLDVDRRSAVVGAARAAIGERLGPLDGNAAARTAAWLMRFLQPNG